MYHSSNDFNISYNILRNDLNILDLWCRKNQLQVNVDKTRAVYFTAKYHNSTSKPLKKLHIGNKDVDLLSSYKYLGVDID